MGTEGCFAGSTAACVRCKADTHLHLTSTLKMGAAVPLLPILVHGVHRDNFTVSVT